MTQPALKIVTDAAVGSHVTVLADDRTVIMDGEAHRCLDSTPTEFSKMIWRPDQKPPGLLERKDRASVNFNDFSIVMPYVEVLRATKKNNLAFAEKAKAEQAQAIEDAKAKTAAEQKARAALEAELKRQAELAKPYHDAVAFLSATDHEIIKAMEVKLAQEKLLPADLLAKREKHRKTAKAEKAKLKD